jgi:hypothetical protein
MHATAQSTQERNCSVFISLPARGKDTLQNLELQAMAAMKVGSPALS